MCYRFRRESSCIAAGIAACIAVSSLAQTTREWTGAGGDTDWFNPLNWSDDGVPATNEHVLIGSGEEVVLSNATDVLDVTLAGTLVFTNWHTVLAAADVTINGTGKMTLPTAFTDAGMSNRVYVTCHDFTLLAGGQILADGLGYAAGNGPGKGLAAQQGGGHGGQGHTSTRQPGGAINGEAETALHPGSGGFATGGSAGGGAVRVVAGGHVVVNGTISADGTGNVAAPGSGGSVYIGCQTFAGTNGTIRANGGGPAYSSGNGGGGGGRIALVYDTSAQTNLPVPQVTFSAAGGKRLNANTAHPFIGELGSLYLSDASWLTSSIPHSGRLVIPGFTSWNVLSLTVTGWVRFPAENFTLEVDGNVLVSGQHARLDIGQEQWADLASFNMYCSPEIGPTLTVGGDLTLSSAGRLSIYAGVTNGTPGHYGARVDVAGDIAVGAYCWIYPFSHPTNGGSPLIRAANVTVDANGGFDASGFGFPGGYLGDGYGDGAGTGTQAGAGYGGLGCTGANQPSGATYASDQAPLAPGSGGSSTTSRGGNGGGLVRIEASGTVTHNGILKADAMPDGSINTHVGGNSAGGSGGGIYVRCKTIDGTGTFSAKGGNSTSSYSGAGGGGRIAVWFRNDLTAAPLATLADVAPGASPTATTAEGGTVFWGQIPPLGTRILVR